MFRPGIQSNWPEPDLADSLKYRPKLRSFVKTFSMGVPNAK